MVDVSISIALCTYNGERYVREQLESIVRQTRPPDELVVCDDCSTDRTVEIVNEFARNATFRVRASVHSQRLGVWRNFESAVSACSGQIIFMSDQDDVWREDKIELMSRKLISTPNAGGVFSDAEIVEFDLSPRGGSLWELIDFTPARQRRYLAGQSFEELLDHHSVQAASLAFWSHHRPMMLPFGPSWPHDSWTSIIVAACAHLIPMDHRLMKWRQHDANTVGISKSVSSSRLQKFRQKWLGIRTRYHDKLKTVDGQLTQLKELQTRLEQQDAPQRFAKPLAALAHRRAALEYRRRSAIRKLALLCDFSAARASKNGDRSILRMDRS